MNYFAHGRSFVDDPYFLAGTAVPDWLCVVDRKVRVRSKSAAPWVEDDDPQLAALARGVVRHHRDDDAFHRTRAFAELSWQLTVAVRDALAPDDGLRPSFLAHLLVELLLDAALIEEEPERLEAYYRALGELDSLRVQRYVNRLATRQTDRLATLIPKFSQVRFLSDYAEDDKLFYRLNQVMRRVNLPQLPQSLSAVLPHARGQVKERRSELLPDVWDQRPTKIA